MAEVWRPDVLGEGFEQLTLPLGTDDEGPVVATLVRSLPPWRLRPRPLHDVDVLYVHGWTDYFFQISLARFWTDRGARFFALDLRKHGRSLREGQTEGFITDLETYDEDIAAALTEMRRDAPRRRLVLFGHSTGGLTLSLWTCRHPGKAQAVILNSPWLEFQFSAAARAALSPVVELRAKRRPLDAAPQLDFGYYARALETVADADDPVTVNLDWRPELSWPVRAAWLDAILKGHNLVAAGLDIDAPVCVLLSARSAPPLRWSADLTNVDSVLVVDDIARAALRLGSSVTIERIDGALHDVFLSRKEPREDAYRRLDRWARGCLAPRL
ncbi:alpha/beta hydrolase [Agrococcus sp. ProA11]|uniref:alpha/beta hydrolase n=1 Tax=Agrococcus chionoecetis TaxID=3153752 RepID=UPI0032605348